MKISSFLLILSLAIVLGVTVFVLYWGFKPTKHVTSLEEKPAIYCIMITGKDDCRYKLGQLAIQNFNDQSYPNKNMIIINHGSQQLAPMQKNILEIHIEKTSALTLGDMRNMALELVPFNAKWITWDDDDYRAPNFLEVLQAASLSRKADVLAITNRIEYNYNTKLVWKMTVKTGMVFFLAKKDARIRYKSVESMEDTEILADYVRYGHVVSTLDNDFMLYIRLVHGNNTSLYIDPLKRAIAPVNPMSTYVEQDTTIEEKAEANKIISSYYKGIPCILTN